MQISKLRLLFSIFLLVLSVFADLPPTSDKKQWKDYKAKFGKPYKLETP